MLVCTLTLCVYTYVRYMQLATGAIENTVRIGIHVHVYMCSVSVPG